LYSEKYSYSAPLFPEVLGKVLVLAPVFPEVLGKVLVLAPLFPEVLQNVLKYSSMYSFHLWIVVWKEEVVFFLCTVVATVLDDDVN
jgi:hypothetical protein